jgi:predicted thioesterase
MARDAEPIAVAEFRFVVTKRDLASELSDDPAETYPAVLATTRMVALMELASGRCLLPLLEPGECSVGVGVDVRHTAPTAPGVTVTARARYVGRDGKLYRFAVEAHDEAGLIGSGTHTRAIVSETRILQAAMRRAAK